MGLALTTLHGTYSVRHHHFGQYTLAPALRKFYVGILSRLAIYVTLQRGGCATQYDIGAIDATHNHGTIACVVAWGNVALFVVYVVLLVYDDKSRGVHR